MEVLEKEETKIAYEISGNGKGQKMVLIHDLFLNSDCWKYQLERFEEEYHILRFDLHGHGRSIKPKKEFTISHLSSDMSILLEHIEWDDDLILVGHSLGALIALAYALKHPKAISKMILIGAFCFARHEAITKILGRVQSQPIREFALQIGERGLVPHDEEEAEWLAHQMIDYMEPEDAVHAINAYAGVNFCGNLRSLQIPVLVIVGENDESTPVWASETIDEWLPESEMVIVEEAGHLVIVDHHKELNDLIEGFLKE